MNKKLSSTKDVISKPPHSVPLVSKYLWLGVVLVSFSPLLLLKESPGIAPVELAISFVLILVFFLWILKTFVIAKPIRLRPLDLSIILLFSFFILDFSKVLFLDMKITDWLHWRRFIFLLLFFPVSTEFFKKKRVDGMFYLLISLSAFISLLEIYDALRLSSITSLSVAGTITSVYPMWTAIFLLGTVRFILRKDIELNNIVKVLFMIALGVCLIDVLSFARRTPFLLVIISIFLSIFFGLKTQKRIPIAAIVVILLILVFLLYFSGLYKTFMTRVTVLNLEHPVKQRLERYKIAFQQFLKNPILGSSEGGPIRYYDLRDKVYVTGSIHSIYLEILAKGGLIGGLVFAFFIYKVFSFLTSVLKKKIPIKLRMYTEASLITVICMFISGLTSTRMHQVESWLFLALLLGLVNGLYFITFRGTDDKENRIKDNHVLAES